MAAQLAKPPGCPRAEDVAGRVAAARRTAARPEAAAALRREEATAFMMATAMLCAKNEN